MGNCVDSCYSLPSLDWLTVDFELCSCIRRSTRASNLCILIRSHNTVVTHVFVGSFRESNITSFAIWTSLKV